MKIKEKYISGRNITKFVFVFSIVLAFSGSVLAQSGQGNNWYFGGHAGIKFTNGTPASVNGGATTIYNNLEGTATISDSLGNLLFYTDGLTVWNKNHAVMETGLMGHPSATQSGVIVPSPGNHDTFYIFTIDATQNNLNNGLRYSMVSMKLNGGLGDVISSKKNVLLSPTGVKMAEKITGVRHCNNVDIWVIAHGYTVSTSTAGKNFYAFQVTPTGIITTPVITTIGTEHKGADNYGYGNSRGYMKASPDGRRLALAITYDGCSSVGSATACAATTGSFEVFDFNYSTGVLSNPIKLTNKYKGAYGIEFSPNGDVLYGSTWASYGSTANPEDNKIYQFNLKAGNQSAIQASEKTIANESLKYSGSKGYYSNYGALQLSSNGKIYISRYYNGLVSSISYPNKLGSSSVFTSSALSLGSNVCSFGLPTFVQSYFNPNLGFNYIGNFEDMVTQFVIYDSLRIDSVLWMFDDTCAGQKNTSKSFKPNYTYCDTGDYQVRLIIWKCNTVDTITHIVNIYSRPDAAFSIDDSIQCQRENVFRFTNDSYIKKGSIVYDKWYFGDGDTSNVKNPVHHYKNPGKYTIRLVETSDHGGMDSVTKQVTVLYSPVANWDVLDSSLCFKDNIFIFDNTSTIGSSSTVKYVWDFGDGDTSHAITPSFHTYLTTDSFWVTLAATSDSFCTDSSSRYLYTRPMPNSGFTLNDSTQCLSGNSFVFNDLSSVSYGSLTYRYQFGDNDSTTTKNPTHSYSTANTFTIRQIVTTNYNCRDTSFHKSIVYPNPDVVFSINDSTQCLLNNSVTFTNTSTLSNGTLSYLWKFGDTNTSSVKNPAHIYTDHDTFTVKLFAYSEQGCPDSQFKKVYIYPTPNSDFSINDSSQCYENNLFITTNTSTINWGTMTYSWKFGDNDSSNSNSPTHSYTFADTFSIKLIAKSALGCRDTTIKNVYVWPKPSAAFSINDTDQCLLGNQFNFTNQSTIASGTKTYYWTFGDGNSSTSLSPSHTYSTFGDYKVKLLVHSGFDCTDSVTHTVHVRPMPSADFNIPENAKCLSGNSFNFNNTSSIVSGTYTSFWNFGDLTTSTSANPSHSYAYDDTFMIRLIVTSNYGCLDTADNYLYVFPQPEIHISVNDSNQCLNGNDFAFTNTSTINSGSLSYIWFFGDGNSINTASTNHTYLSDDTFTVKLFAVSNLGCQDSVYLKTYVFPNPSSLFDINDTTQCFNENWFIYTNSSSIHTGTYSNKWYLGDGLVTNRLNMVYAYSIDDTFLVKLVTESDLGCSDSSYQTVYVFPSPEIDFSINDTIQCYIGHQFDFTNNSSINSGSQTYYWGFGDGNSSTLTSPTHQYATDDTFSIKLLATSNLGCKDSLFKTIYLFPSPAAIFSINDSQQCFNENQFVYTNSSTIHSGSTSFKWYFGDGSSSTTVSPTNKYLLDDTFTVKLIATSGLGCKDSVEKTTYVFPSPETDFSINDTIQCYDGHQFDFTNNSSINSGSQTYYWGFGDGNSSTLTSPTHQYATDDTFSIKLLATSNLGCKDSLFKTIYLFPSPVAIFSINDSQQCFNENQFVYTNSSTIHSGSTSFNWYFGDGNSSILESLSYKYNLEDTFTVKLVVTSGLNCRDSLLKVIIVDPSPVSDFNITDSAQCLNGNDFVFLNNTTIKNGSLSYSWRFGDGIISTLTNPTHAYTSDDTFSIWMIAKSGRNCFDSVSRKIITFPMPVASFTANDSTQCLRGNNFIFTNNSSINTGSSSYLWTFGDGANSNSISPNHTYLAHDTFLIKLLALSNLGCRDSNYINSYVYPMPVSSFSINDSTQCLSGNSFIFSNLTSIPSGSLSYLWSFGDGQTANTTNTAHSYLNHDTLTVKLVANSALGCSDSLSKTVQVYPMPSASFTVNDSTQCLRGNNYIFSNNSNIIWGSNTYLWSFGDNSNSTNANPTYNYINPDTFTTSLMVSSAYGCKDSSFISNIVFPMPYTDFSINDSSQCLRYNQYIFTNGSGIMYGSLSYLWNFGDLATSTQTNPSHNYSSFSNYNVSLLAVSGNGCRDSIIKLAYVRPMPKSQFAIYDSSQCFEKNAFGFTNLSTVSYGSMSYRWNFGDTGTAFTTNPIHSYSYADTFVVTLISTSDYNCRDTFSANTYIHVHPEPVANFTIDDTAQCLKGNLFKLTNQSLISSGSMSNIWSFGDTGSSVFLDPTHVYGNHDTFTIKLMVISDWGCKDSALKKAYVWPMPVAAFDINDSSQCLYQNEFTYYNKSTIPWGIINPSWNLGDNTFSTRDTVTHSYSNHDTLKVWLTMTSQFACMDSIGHFVYVHPMPEADFSVIDSNECVRGNYFVFTDKTTISSGILSWDWNFGDGSDTTLQSPNHTYLTDDTFTVKMRVQSHVGCPDSAYMNVYTFPMPVSSFTINDSAQCYNENEFEFTNTSNITYGNLTYFWDFGDGQSSLLTQPVHKYSTDDTFTVKLVVTSHLGCQDSSERLVIVHPSPESDFVINDSQQCFNENQFIYSNLSTIHNGTTNYNWYFGDGNSSVLINSSNKYLSDDTFMVKLLVTSALGCKDSTLKNTYVFPSPETDFFINDSIQCFNGHEFSFTNTSLINTGSQTYLWDFGDTNTSIQTSTVHQYTIDDTFAVKLLATSNLGCKDSVYRIVYLFPSPVALFSINDSQQCFNENIFAFTNQTTINSGSIGYNWNFGDGFNSVQSNPQHIYLFDDTLNVQLIATSVLGCKDSINKSVYVFPSPETDFSVNDSQQCFIGNLFEFTNLSSINSGNQSYFWDFGDLNTSILKDPNHSYTSDDTFRVKLLALSNLGCWDSIYKTNYVFPNPVAGFSVNNSQQCFNGNNFIFTNTSSIHTGNMNYDWTFGDGIKSTLLSPSHSYTTDDSFIVKMVITSGLYCKDSIESNVYVFPSPKTAFTINNAQQCLKFNYFTFTNNSTINTGSQNYIWDFDDKDTSTFTDSEHKYLYDSTFGVKLLAISDLGCKDSLVKNVVVYPAPIPAFDISDSQQCFNGNNFIFANKSSVHTGNITYQWNFGDLGSSTAQSPSHSYTTDDTFSVRLIVTSDKMCKDTIVKSIYVFPSPNTAFSIDNNSQCLRGNKFNFTNLTTINTGSFSNLWDFGDFTNSSGVNVNHTYLNEDTLIVKLISTSGLGCQDSTMKNVYIHPMPDSKFTINDSAQCLRGNLYVFNNLSTNAYGTMSYLWQYGDGKTSTVTNPSYTYLTYDTFNVDLIVTSGNGCKDTSTKYALVHPMPVAGFSVNNTSQCLRGNKFDYTNNSTIAYGSLSYLWDFGDMQNSPNINPSHSFLNQGNYTSKLIVTSALGCIDSTIKTMFVRPMPVAAFAINDSTQCLRGNDYQFTNNTTIASGSMTFNWVFGDGNTSGATNSAHTYSADGTFKVKLIAVSDVYNCKDSISKFVEVYPMPKADFEYSIPCLAQNILFTDISTINSPGIVNAWFWDFKDGNTSTQQDPTQTYLSSGTYSVSLTAISDKLCRDSIEHNVIIYPNTNTPIIDRATVLNKEEVLVEWSAINQGRPRHFILERSLDNLNFSHLSDVLPDILNYNDQIVNVNKFSYTYRVSVLDSCDYQTHWSNIGKTILLSVDTTGEFPKLTWTPYEDWAAGVMEYEILIWDHTIDNFLTLGTTNNSTFTFVDERSRLNQVNYCYTILAHRNIDGQVSASNEVCIPTPFNLYAPNAFTPNGDDLNNKFEIIGTHILNFSIVIYSRWGEEIFRSDDINNSWDGTYKGQPCPSGQYAYIIDSDGTSTQHKVLSGTVLLLR